MFSASGVHEYIAARDNYALVLLMIVLSILLMAVTDVAPIGRILALIVVGATLLYAVQASGLGVSCILLPFLRPARSASLCSKSCSRGRLDQRAALTPP